LKVLVIGSGSIGQRHIKNLKLLGIKDIQVFDNDKKLLKLVEKKFKIKAQNELNFDQIDCTLICTPPNSHIKLAKLALEKNSNIFIEKPLSDSLKNIDVISKIAKKKSLKIFVGYVFRFDKGLIKINKILKKMELAILFHLMHMRDGIYQIGDHGKNLKKVILHQKKWAEGLFLMALMN